MQILVASGAVVLSPDCWAEGGGGLETRASPWLHATAVPLCRNSHRPHFPSSHDAPLGPRGRLVVQRTWEAVRQGV